MADYRRVTQQCARDDWRCHTHEDVVASGGATDLLKQFFSQTPATWYAGDAPRDRRRNVKSRQKAPGTRVIGSLKVEGFRAWVWADDGSVFDIEGSFSGFDLHWMIAYGNRRQGHRSDLQEKRKSLLQDPEDTWRPTETDYESLLEDHDDGFTDRAVKAIKQAVDEASRHHNVVVEIVSDDIGGHVVHEHDEDVDDVDGMVVEEINERWLLLAKQRSNGRRLTYEDALALAPHGYPANIYPELVSARHDIRDGLLMADPATHYVFYAELSS